MLDHILSPQIQWNKYNKFIKIILQDTSLYKDLVDLLSDEINLK